MMHKDINEAVMDESVDSIDEELSDEMDRRQWVRETTLYYCYSIPDYPYLDRDTQGDVYETIREIVERLDSAYARTERIESGRESE